MQDFLQEVARVFDAAREKKPIVHHITNYVTVNDCANIVLAAGGSPIMADDEREVPQIASISAALVLNIGTLNARTLASMLTAGKEAAGRGIPVVFDPVGAGASTLRGDATARILQEAGVSVLRGNISEIRFAAGAGVGAKGVDAAEADVGRGMQAAREVAKAAAGRYGLVAAVTGAVDVVTDGVRTVYIENGTPLLSRVTGTGCMCTSLIGTFCGVCDDALAAAAAGILAMSLAGELAAERAAQAGTGSFHIALVDAVSRLDSATVLQKARIRAEE